MLPMDGNFLVTAMTSLQLIASNLESELLDHVLFFDLGRQWSWKST